MAGGGVRASTTSYMLSEGSDPANPPNQNIRTKVIKNEIMNQSLFVFLLLHASEGAINFGTPCRCQERLNIS